MNSDGYIAPYDPTKETALEAIHRAMIVTDIAIRAHKEREEDEAARQAPTTLNQLPSAERAGREQRTAGGKLPVTRKREDGCGRIPLPPAAATRRRRGGRGMVGACAVPVHSLIGPRSTHGSSARRGPKARCGMPVVGDHEGERGGGRRPSIARGAV